MYVAGYNALVRLLHNAIVAYEYELEQQDYPSAEELHAAVLNELSMTEQEYIMVMGRKYEW